jgi:hypothetical protein
MAAEPLKTSLGPITFVNKNLIQQELNEKWAIPLQLSFAAYRCGYEAQGDAILKGMLDSSSGAVKTSVISYGFVLGYSEYLDSLVYNDTDRPSICGSFIEKEASAGIDNDPQSFEKVSTVQAVEKVIDKTGLKANLGDARVNDLLISTQAIQSQYGLVLNKSVLMTACNMPDANREMPSAVDIINSAKMVGEANGQKIKDALDVWFGFSQGSYWHALNLVNKSTERTSICHNLNIVKAA